MNTIKDKEIQDGDQVILVCVPDELIRGLPEYDQLAIKRQEGKVLTVQSTNDDGLVELECVDDTGNFHFIWVQQENISLSKKSTQDE